MIARLKPLSCAVVVLLCGVLLSAQGSTPPPSSGPRRLEILFLGHASTHHDSGRFAPMLQAALAQYGFNFSYTTDLADLNPANLAQYDALMIYANHTRITPEQEKALLDFVAGGKGFLPIHSASYCFQNSEAYIALVGAQFQRHGTGEFTTEFTNTAHPVMAGLKPFQVWDETYVHTKHNPVDRTVLMERVDAQGREPWTWVRTHGKGRVFYTAYGHDERVWNNPNFHSLIRNAITWAVGPQAAGQLAALRLQPLRYSEGIVPIPNYERREVTPKLQAAFSPADAIKRVQVPPGFEVQLFAAEPLVTGNPEAMAWDERGRLWVAETKDYPNNLSATGQGNDVIKILEDTNRDGRADKATVFADKLNIVSSLVFANGGIIISQAGELVALKDTNGDDQTAR
jgi:type 1 glutamine amidotransferase